MSIKTAEAIEFDALGQKFSLKMGFAAVCKIEEVYEKGFYEVFSNVISTNMRFTDMLKVFHACMMREDCMGKQIEDVTREEAAAIIDDIGVEKVSSLITQALEASPLIMGKGEEKPKVRGAGPAKAKAKAG